MDDQTKEEVKRRINEAKSSTSGSLDLSRLPLDSFPKEAFELNDVKEINISYTSIEDFQPLKELENLKVLKAGNTKLNSIDFVEVVPGLQTLLLTNTRISSIEKLTQLSQLNTLDLENTLVEDFEPLSRILTLQRLYLDGTKLSDVTLFSSLERLEILFVDDTAVSHLEALENLASLIWLTFKNTNIRDLHPISNLAHLRWLDISGSKVEDIAPLASLAKLVRLSIEHCRIRDLRPLLALDNLWNMAGQPLDDTLMNCGIWFEDTTVTQSNSEMKRISGLLDDVERAGQTRQFLQNLPGWPTPIESELPEKDGHKPAASEPPGNKPAPVMVRLDDTGRIVNDPPDHALEDAMLDRARQAWEALRSYLDDLEEFRTGIGQNMPVLRRSFDSLERALGAEFDALNEIDLGMQAERLRLLADDADTYLMDQNPTELKAFVAQLGLYMQRFNTWIVYQDDLPDPYSQQLPEDRADFEALADGLRQTENVDERVNATLDDVTETGTAPDATPLERKGALDSHVNMLDTISERALAEREALGEGGYATTLQDATLGALVGVTLASPAAAGSVYAVLFLYNNQQRLERLAARYPAMSFITGVLRYLFP